MGESSDPPSENRRLRTSSAWEDALKELERSAPAPKAAAAMPVVAAAAPPTVAKPAPREPGPTEQLRGLVEKLTKAHDTLKSFEKAHPYLVAPNIIGLWEVHLKESAVMLQRELERIERG